jgi:hypothetical protein
VYRKSLKNHLKIKKMKTSKTTKFLSVVEKTNNVLENCKSAKTIYSQIYALIGEIGENFIDLIEQNSNDFTKDIAVKYNRHGQTHLSDKQCWCLAYQIFNNIEVYKIANNNQ